MTVLDAILRQKRTELSSLSDAPNAIPSTRSFIAALRTKHPCLIAEIKPKSPSAGMLMNSGAIPETVHEYNRRAQAISVLCDREFFGGGFDVLQNIRSQTDLPILAKEFIVDAKQIQAARQAGADAVLLIAAILGAGDIQRLAREVVTLGMAVLLELHDATEIDRIPDLTPETMVLGINNRDLATLQIDLETTVRLAPLIRKRFPGHVLIAESGVATQDDLARLRPAVDGFLIGTGLLTGTMPGAFPPLER